MTQSDVQDVPVEDEGTEAAGTSHCRHCGRPQEHDTGDSDWLCDNCERFQDQMTCPTCKQPARISLLPADVVPEPHAPTRRRK